METTDLNSYKSTEIIIIFLRKEDIMDMRVKPASPRPPATVKPARPAPKTCFLPPPLIPLGPNLIAVPVAAHQGKSPLDKTFTLSHEGDDLIREGKRDRNNSLIMRGIECRFAAADLFGQIGNKRKRADNLSLGSEALAELGARQRNTEKQLRAAKTLTEAAAIFGELNCQLEQAISLS